MPLAPEGQNGRGRQVEESAAQARADLHLQIAAKSRLDFILPQPISRSENSAQIEIFAERRFWLSFSLNPSTSPEPGLPSLNSSLRWIHTTLFHRHRFVLFVLHHHPHLPPTIARFVPRTRHHLATRIDHSDNNTNTGRPAELR